MQDAPAVLARTSDSTFDTALETFLLAHAPAPALVPIDGELMDLYRLSDGELDTATELPVPVVPQLEALRLEPPAVQPPTFRELWFALLAAESPAPTSPVPSSVPDSADVALAEPAPRPVADELAVAELDVDEAPTEEFPPVAGQMITLFSPKGGAGTSVLATNLALVLAAAGRHRVCLVDLDLEFGDVSIMAGLTPARTVGDAADRNPQEQATFDAIVTPWRDGVDCVLAPVDPSAAEQVTPQLVGGVLAALRSRYDYVVVDTPSHFGEHVLDALEAADHQILVCTPQIPALKNLRLTLDTLQLLGSDPARCSVVLNQVLPKGLTPEAAQEAIVHPIAAAIPASTDVAGSIDAGTPLATERHGHPVVAALASLAGAITGEPVGAVRRSLLGRRTRRAAA